MLPSSQSPIPEFFSPTPLPLRGFSSTPPHLLKLTISIFEKSLLLFLCSEKPYLSVTHPTWGMIQKTEILIVPYAGPCGLYKCLLRDDKGFQSPKVNPPRSTLWPMKLLLETECWATAWFQDQWKIKFPPSSDDTFFHLVFAWKEKYVEEITSVTIPWYS